MSTTDPPPLSERACADHPDTLSTQSCAACLRGCCDECATEVLGRPYCALCLAERLEPPLSEPVKLPWLAALLSVVPGLGQVYNGLVVRGLAHFVVFSFLIWLVGQETGITLLVCLGWIGFWVWQALDARNTARDINRLGRVPNPDEAHALGLGPLLGADRESRGLGIALVVVGALLLLQNFGGELGRWLAHLWPIALVVAGIWLLRRGREERVAARPVPDAGPAAAPDDPDAGPAAAPDDPDADPAAAPDDKAENPS